MDNGGDDNETLCKLSPDCVYTMMLLMTISHRQGASALQPPEEALAPTMREFISYFGEQDKGVGLV
jgi:hypothetical protein